MQDEVCIGSCPYDEPCAQLGQDSYHEQARQECKALIRQLRRVFGGEPEGARLYIKRNKHDFGTYLTVECAFDDNVAEARWYAFTLESSLPANWDAKARRELHLDGEGGEGVGP